MTRPALAFDPDSAAVRHRQDLVARRSVALLNIRRVCAEVDQLEFQPRSLSNQALQLFGILDSGHLDEDPVPAFGHDRDFLGSARIDPAPDDIDNRQTLSCRGD